MRASSPSGRTCSAGVRPTSPSGCRRCARPRAYQAGDVATDLEYYRIHFDSAFRRPDQLDRLIGRLRSAFTSEGIVTARAIEDRLYAQTWDAEDYDLIARLGRLRIPTLFLHGDGDLVPIEVAREAADAIRGSRFVVLPDCGHFAYLEQPDRVRAAIAELMQRHRP